MNFRIIVEDDNQERLDSYLADNLREHSRSYIKKLIDDKFILVNGKSIKSSYNVRKDDLVEINIPKAEKIQAIPQNIPINIIYEDKDIVLVNKAQGMVVHPGVDNESGTLVNGLLYHIDSLSTINKDIRPGIVHRIDKDTSGILVVAKNNMSHKSLACQFKERRVRRVYIALVHGVIDQDKGIINAPIGRNKVNRTRMSIQWENGREAISSYKVITRFHKYSLLEVSLETGRTHQIRVHLEYLNHPIVGEPLYSNRQNKFSLDKQLLHAYKLGFIHPSKNEYLEYTADLPSYFSDLIEKL